MWETLKNAWKITELRKKLTFTLMMLLLYRLASYIPIPGINQAILKSQATSSNGVMALMSMITGGTLDNMTLMGLGIAPYINASIIMQLLTIVVPKWGALAKEGGEGRKKLNKYTRYMSLAISVVMAFVFLYTRPTYIDKSFYGDLAYPIAMLMLTAGATLAIWMGERITERGIGNGISLLIFAGIVARLTPYIGSYVTNMLSGSTTGASSYTLLNAIFILVLVVAVIFAIVFIDLGERRVPVQYAKRMSGRKMYGGQSTHIPMKVNSSGVMPLIFASSFVMFPTLILSFAQNYNAANIFNKLYIFFNRLLTTTNISYYIIMGFFVFAFSYFYSQIVFDPVEMSKNIQQYGGFLPGIRPGKPTSDYLRRINYRLVFMCAIFLTILAVLPSLFFTIFSIRSAFGATGLLIVVNVALETSKSLESQMMMRHYKGFLND